jgi:OOP family OmpA-OmpF porin
MRSIVAILVTFVLLLLLYQFGARNEAPEIQADIQSRTAAAIAEGGFADVVVSTDGRDVTLSGTVHSEADADNAESIAEGVWGVRVVDNEIALAVPYAVRICADGARVTATGSAPDAAAIESISARISELFHRRAPVIDLQATAGAPPNFNALVDAMLQDLALLDQGCIASTGRLATIEGSVYSPSVADAIRAGVADVESLGYDVTLKLDVPTLSEEAAACQAEYNRRLAPGERVLFDFDSAELHEEGRQLLDEIVEIGKSCPDVAVVVAGHTDAVGDRQYNIELSQARADVVVEYLVGKGVDPDRLTAVGYGYSQPVADNTSEDGRAKNRRIEFRVRED